MKNKKLFTWGIIALLVLGVGAMVWSKMAPGVYDDFAACLEDKGVKFYGAFWCPHCQNQKALFGNSAKKLPYIECSTPDSKGQLAVCAEKSIKTYPTWIFADESRVEGEMSIPELSDKSGCALAE